MASRAAEAFATFKARLGICTLRSVERFNIWKRPIEGESNVWFNI